MPLDAPLKLADLEPVGPGTPVGRYLRLFWQPILRSRDLPAGRAKPVEILGERFTVYRGASGTPHITSFRCAHRGAQLSVGWVEGDSLRCRYHGWRFEASGACVEQPNEDRPFCDRVRIASFPAREYCGLIFGYFGEGALPPFRHYPDFDQPGVLVVDPPEILPCSFWNRLDNDIGHVPWVHRATALRKNMPSYLVQRRESVEETPYGYISTGAVAGRPADFRGTQWFFMPNARQFWTLTRARGFEGRNLPDIKMTWTVPINDRKHVAFDVTLTPLSGAEAEAYEKSRVEQQEDEAQSRWDLAEKVLAGEMTLEDLPLDMSAYTSFEIEDYAIMVGLGPVTGRSSEHLGRIDVKPMLLRRLYLREIGAMLEDRALTDWKIPTEPFVPARGDRGSQ